MSRTGNRKLSLKRETLRRLAAGQLAQVAGGVVKLRCTDGHSGCQGQPSGWCMTDDCTESIKCDTGL